MTATRISTVRKIGLTLGLALCISTVATLSSFAFSSKARQMCTGDAFRLCSSEIPNIARITACMLRNKANVSQGCRAVMDEEAAAASKPRVAATPVEQPAATEAKPVQAAHVEPKPTTATPVEVMPVEAKSTPKGKPARLAQRKQKHRQQTDEQHIHRDFRNIGWIMGLALSIPFYW